MRPAGPGGYVSTGTVAGGKLLVWPRARRVALEGRLAALASADGADGLPSPTLLREVAARCSEELRWLGLLEGGEPCVVRRLDLATDVHWHQLPAGRALLAAVAEAAPPEGHSLNTWSSTHGVETINLFKTTGHRRELVGRIYDRGAKTGRHPHGEMVRFERQLRWQGAACPPLEAVVGANWTAEAIGWVRQLRAAEMQSVAVDDQERLLALIETGAIPVQTGLRLLGSLVVGQHRDSAAWWKQRGASAPATGRKHRRELAAVGLPSSLPPLTGPDLGAVLSSASSTWEALVTSSESSSPGTGPNVLP